MSEPEVIRMGCVIQQYLERNNIMEARPKELMKPLIRAGFFVRDYRDGLPLRKVLRRLQREKKLYLIPQVFPEVKDKNTWWYFRPTKF